jgi:tRNA threonylcarbamoyladenosine biosynthesis protein TsaE
MKFKTIRIANKAAMLRFAAGLAQQTLANPAGKHAKVIALVGNLGAGKTTFTQGFLKALGVKRRVISPTFLIIRPYKLKQKNFHLAFHIDCYRLNKPNELLVLGFKDLMNEPEHIVLIEWPELVKKYLPRDTLWIEIEHPKKGTARTVSVS